MAAISAVMVASAPAHAPPLTHQPQAFFEGVPPPPEGKPRALMSFEEINEQVADNELKCLAATVYWEAGMEPREGQLAVAHVVLNRVGKPGFANSICGVVKQGGPRFPCQFHWYCSGRDTTPRNAQWWEQAQIVAHDALKEPRDPSEGALYFHLAALKPQGNPARYAQARVIGKHIFFRGRG